MNDWKDRLRAFDDLAPDAEVYARAAQGPRHDLPDGPSGRKRLTAGIVAFAVFGAAAIFAWQAFRPSHEPNPVGPIDRAHLLVVSITEPGAGQEVPNTFNENEPRPTMTATFDGVALDGTPVSYTWCDEPGVNCSSVNADYDITFFQPVPAGTAVIIEGDANDVGGSFHLWRGEGPSFPLDAGVPETPGTYELLVDATFDRGEVTFSSGIEVVAEEQTASEPGMVQSGGTYRLFDLSVVFPLGQSAESSHANVSYSYEWTTESFPGEAECNFTLFDDSGTIVVRYPTGMVGVSPASSGPLSITIPIQNGTPTSVEGTCGPGVVYEGPWNISNVRIEEKSPTVGDLAVIGDLALVGDDSEGMAACALRWLDSSGTEHITAGDMGIVGSSRNRVFFRVPDDAAPDLVPEVRCESYRSPDQLAEAHWLPWPETKDPSTSEPDVGASDVLRIRCDEGGIRVLTPTVTVQADGLHVSAEVTGMANPDVSVRSQSMPDFEYGSGSEGTDGEFVRQVPVGEAQVHCKYGSAQGDGREGFSASFEIVDPADLFTEYDLACQADDALGGQQPSRDGAGSAEGAVLDGVSGLTDSDVVELAGFVGAEAGPIVRVTRDGERIGWFMVQDWAEYGYFIMSGYACPDAGLAIRD